MLAHMHPRPIPPHSDQHLVRKASMHLCLRFDRPLAESRPQKGAGFRPPKRVTKYVPRQFGDTVRDSKFGSPNGPFKKGLPASLAARTHTPALTQDEHAQTPFQHGKAQATHN